MVQIVIHYFIVGRLLYEFRFTYHKEVSEQVGYKTYFAKPYHSWERGQNIVG
jgi:hypothetical protein